MKNLHVEYCCGDEVALVATETDWSTIANALRSAAELYTDYGRNHVDNPLGPGLMQLFREQARRCILLAEEVEREAGV